MKADIDFKPEYFGQAVLDLNNIIDEVTQIRYIMNQMEGYSYILNSDRQRSGSGAFSSAKKDIILLSDKLSPFKEDIRKLSKAMTGYDNYFENMDERKNLKDKFFSLFDWDGDGIDGFTEFSKEISEYDYKEFYGDQVIVTDNGFQMNGAMIDWFADTVFAPLVSSSGKLLIGTTEFVSDYIYDFALSPELAYKRSYASNVNTQMALAEGVVEFGEATVDTIIDIDGKVKALKLSTGAYLCDQLGLDGVADFLQTSSDKLKISNAKIVSYDFSKTLFDKIYENDYYKETNNLSYGLFTRGVEGKGNGVLYEGVKTVGYYLPIMFSANYASACIELPSGSTLTKFFGETGVSTFVKNGIQSLVVAESTYGKESEKNYNNAFITAETEGRGVTVEEIDYASSRAATKASIDGAVIFASGAVKAKTNNTLASIVVKATKPTVSEITTSMVYDYDSDKSFYENLKGIVKTAKWDEITYETIAIFAAEYAGEYLKKLAPKTNPSNVETPTVENVDFFGQSGGVKFSDFKLDISNEVKDGFMKDFFGRVAKEPASKFINAGY